MFFTSTGRASSTKDALRTAAMTMDSRQHHRRALFSCRRVRKPSTIRMPPSAGRSRSRYRKWKVMVVRPMPHSTSHMASRHGFTSAMAGGSAETFSCNSRSKRRSSLTEVTSQQPPQLLPQAVQPPLHRTLRQAQLGGHLGGGLAVVVFSIEQATLLRQQTRDGGL